MSNKNNIPEAMIDPHLSPKAKLIMCYLYNYFPNNKANKHQIAIATSQTLQALSAPIKELVSKKYIHAVESNYHVGKKPIGKTKHQLQVYIEMNFPLVCKSLKPLTYDEAKKLTGKYNSKIIADVLEELENYKNIKNYTSLYLTINNWIKKRNNYGKNNSAPKAFGNHGGRQSKGFSGISGKDEAEDFATRI